MAYTMLSPQETELVARLLRYALSSHDDVESAVVETLNRCKYSQSKTEKGDFSDDDFYFLLGKVNP